MMLFALNSCSGLGGEVAKHLGLTLSQHEERQFEDGEHKSRPLESVRSRDVFVIDSFFSEPGRSVNDKICRLLFFVGALKDAGASRVVAVIPYLAYARKDRRTKARDPVTMKYLARLVEAAGVDHIVSLEAHNVAAYENAFRIPTEHLNAHGLFANWLGRQATFRQVVVVSPDPGGIKRAELFRERLSAVLGRDIGKAFIDKRRSEGRVTGDTLVGDVKDADVVVIDDIISSGTTIARAIDALAAAGARRAIAALTHGIFVGDASVCLAHPHLDCLLVTDSIPPFRVPAELFADRAEVLSVAPLLGDAIRCIHEGKSITALMLQV